MRRRWRGRSIVVGSLAFLAGARAIHAAEVEQAAPEQAVAQPLAGAGAWASERDGQGARNWQVRIEKFSDDSIEGRIFVVGSAVVQEARIQGRVEAGEIYGVLVDGTDHQVGTFNGTPGAQGYTGSYTFANGDTGAWNWAGPAAQELKPAGENP